MIRPRKCARKISEKWPRLVAQKCSKCGSSLKEVVVDLEHNLKLHFLICKNCKYLRKWAIDRIEEKLKSGVDWKERWLREHLDRYLVTLKLIPFSSKKLTILDVGAYPGYLTRMIKQLFGYETYSLDSSDVISSANFQDYTAAMQQSGIIVKDCNVDENSFPFANETFDMVLFTEVVEHLHKPEYALTEINRVLRTKGQLIFSTVNFLKASNRVKDMIRKPTTYHGVKEYTIKELKELLTDTKFVIKKVIFSDWEEKKLVKRVFKSPQQPIFSNLWTMVKYGLAKVMPSLSTYIFIVAIKG